MARKIVITSGKGGVGKSTICFCLAKQLAKTKAKVVVLDVDVGLHNLDVVSGIQQKIMFDVVDVVEGRVRVEQALIQDDEVLDLFYLPSCHTNNIGKVSPQNLKDILLELSSFDYILLDCPAGIDFDFHTAVFGASEALIVTTPNITAINSADKVASLLCNYNLDGVGLVVNRMQKTDFLSDLDIAKALKLPLFGSFFENKSIRKCSTNDGILKNLNSKFKKSLEELSNNVFYGNYQVFKEFKVLKGVLWKNKI